MLIAISGTPGTGKSTLAKHLQKKGFYRIDLHAHYRELSVGYNHPKKCYDLNHRKFVAFVHQEINQQQEKQQQRKVVIDSHLAHFLPLKLVDLCIVLTCSNLKELERRLKRRKYSLPKIMENLDAEIFKVCALEAQERGHQLLVIDTATASPETILQKVYSAYSKIKCKVQN